MDTVTHPSARTTSSSELGALVASAKVPARRPWPLVSVALMPLAMQMHSVAGLWLALVLGIFTLGALVWTLTTDRGDRALAVHEHGLVVTGPRKRTIVVPWTQVRAVRTDAVGLHLATDQGVVTLPQALDRNSGVFALVRGNMLPAAGDEAPEVAQSPFAPASMPMAAPSPETAPHQIPAPVPEAAEGSTPAQVQRSPWLTAGAILLAGAVIAAGAALSIRESRTGATDRPRPVAAGSASTTPGRSVPPGSVRLSDPTQRILTADSTFLPAMMASLHAKGIIMVNYLAWDASGHTANIVVQSRGSDIAYSYTNGQWGAPRRSASTLNEGNKIDTRTVTFDYISKVRAWLDVKLPNGWVQLPRAAIVSGAKVPTLLLRSRDTTVPAVHDGSVCYFAERVAFIDLPTGNYYTGAIETDFPESCS